MGIVTIAASRPKKKKIGSELIRWYQGGTEYSHVLIIREGIVYQSHSSGCDIMFLGRFTEENIITFSIEIPEEKIDWDFINKSLKVDTGYGFTQILKIALKYLFGIVLRDNGNKRLVCSEFVGKALRLNWVNDYTDPEDIVTYLKGL